MFVQSVRIYSTVHLTASLYERGSPAAQAGSHEGCCLATSLPHSYSLSSGFCGIKAHLCRVWRMDCPWSETDAVFARQSAVLCPARCGSKSVSLRFIFRHIHLTDDDLHVIASKLVEVFPTHPFFLDRIRYDPFTTAKIGELRIAYDTHEMKVRNEEFIW